MYDIQTQVLKVEGQTTKTGGTRWIVAFADGSDASTFDQAVANIAWGLNQQAVTARIEDKPNPRNPQRPYKNLIAIAAPGQLQPLPAAGGTPVQTVGPPMVGSPTGAPGSTTQGPIPSAAPRTEFNRQTNPVDAERMATCSVFSTAFGFASYIYAGTAGDGVEEAKKLAYDIARELFGHVQSSGQAEEPAAEGPIIPTASSPQEAAAQVNEVLGTQAVQVGAPVNTPAPAQKGPSW